MSKKEKLTPEQELYQRRTAALGTEEIMKRALQAEAIRNTPFWIAPPKSAGESQYFGWLRGMAFEIETVANGRWYYWLSILNKGEYDGQPIPKITMRHGVLGTLGYKMLERCVDITKQEGYGIQDFIEFIGFSLGIAWFRKPKISERLWRRLYETFNLDLLILEPADYLSMLMCNHGFSGWLEFYPTPGHVASFMAQISIGDTPDYTKSAYEPTAGTGSILLQADILNLVGTDLNEWMAKAASIQAFLYAPWLLYCPTPIIGLHYSREEQRMNKYFEFDTNTRYYSGDALVGEFRAPRDIFEENSEFVDVYLSPLDVTKRSIILYEEEMQQDWQTLSKEVRFEITKACCREMGFDMGLGNPPFGKLPAMCRDNIRAIEENNRIVLDEREKRLREANKKPHPMVAQVVEDVKKKQAEIEVVFDEKKGSYCLAI